MRESFPVEHRVMFEEINAWLVFGAAGLGIAFGAVLQRSRLCLVAAVGNLALVRDWRQLHGFVAALAVALLGTWMLEWGGWVAISDSAYRSAALNWLGVIIGGLVFGFGSLLAGGCAARTVVRASEGNLGAWTTLLAFAFGAMAALYGVLQPLRIWLMQYRWEPPGGDIGVAAVLGIEPWLPVVLLVGLGLLTLLLCGRRNRSWGLIIAGGLAGTLVVAGWWLSGYWAVDEFEPTAPVSASIVGPLARTGVLLATADTPQIGFGVAFLTGIAVGALASALLSRDFRWRPPHGSQVGPALVGGFLMGVGAIVAGGCNIGNGLTGVSTGSLGSLLALVAMVVGMLLGLRWVGRSGSA